MLYLGGFQDESSNKSPVIFREFMITGSNLQVELRELLDSRSRDTQSDIFIVACDLECILELMKQVHNRNGVFVKAMLYWLLM